MAQGNVFLRVRRFSSVGIIPPLLHNHVLLSQAYEGVVWDSQRSALSIIGRASDSLSVGLQQLPEQSHVATSVCLHKAKPSKTEDNRHVVTSDVGHYIGQVLVP